MENRINLTTDFCGWDCPYCGCYNEYSTEEGPEECICGHIVEVGYNEKTGQHFLIG